MTLALSGKSRRRQTGLVATALLAIAFAAIAALWSMTAAFAHHLDSDVQEPVCNDQAWKIEVSTGGWSNYREAVLTQNGATSLSFPSEFDGGAGPFVYKGSDRTIVSASGSGLVDSQGKVEQYTGSFGRGEDLDEDVNSTQTNIPIDGNIHPGYQVGGVIRIGNELMKITAIDNSPPNRSLDVIRGFGGTTAVSHNDGPGDEVTVWLRGNKENQYTQTWDLDFNPANCATGADTCEDLGLTHLAKYEWKDGAWRLDSGSDVIDFENPLSPASQAWTSDEWIGAIITRIGQPQAPAYDFNVFNYDPAIQGGTFTNAGLTNPGDQNAAISNLDFCGGDPPRVFGNLWVKKVVTNVDDDPTGFDGNVLLDGAPTGHVFSNLAETDAPKQFEVILDGLYTVEEVNIDPDYTFLGLAKGNWNDKSCPAGPDAGYTGETVDDTDTGNGGDLICVYNQKNEPDEVTVVATKIVCPAEGYLPDAADGIGADGVQRPIHADTAANFLAENPECSIVPWTFEYQWGGSNPGDNAGDTSLADFNGNLTIPIQTDKTLWIREQKPADYIDFAGQTSNTPQVSAEFYCSADVLNYDNWERIESTNGKSDIEAGKTYYCVGFNVLAEGEIHNAKVVVNDDDDATPFTANVTGTENFTSGSFSQAGGHATNKAGPGFYSAVENELPGYEYLGTELGTIVEGQVVCPAYNEQPAPELFSQLDLVQEGYELVAGDDLVFCHYNRAVGTVVLIKDETHRSDVAETWDFDAAVLNDPSLTTTANPGAEFRTDQETFLNVPVGSYSISELQGLGACVDGDTSDDFQTQARASIGSIPKPDPGTDVIGNGALDFSVETGQTTYIKFENQGCGTVLAAANIVVRKFEDLNGDFDANDAGEGPLAGWTITITGTGGAAAGFGPVSQQTDASGIAFFGGVPDGTYTVSETPQGSHNVVGSVYTVGVGVADPTSTDNDLAGASRSGLSVGLNETLKVDFFNQPRGTIVVEKTVVDNVGSEDAEGWEFTLVGCGIFKSDTTNAAGVVVFDNLDTCASYVVTETAANQDDFSTTPFSGSHAVSIAPGDEVTVEFTNRRDPEGTPTTTTPEVPETPETPPVDPTEEPTEEPTEVPTDEPTEEPTEEPTDEPTEEPTEDVAGEMTPGPGAVATPIAPDTGSGLSNNSAGGSILLALFGIVIITGGIGLMALGRKTA